MNYSDATFWTAIGTVAAVIVALGVALAQATVAIVLFVKRRRLARRNVASLVSAWIKHVYAPAPSGDYYRRTVSLHVANESDEPVFKVEVICGIATEDGLIQLGPLSAPRVIPVLPPKREFVYDVTMGMLAFGGFAHDTFRGLVAEVGFRDHEGNRWERGFNGDLQIVSKPRTAVPTEADDELKFAQAGPVDHPYNPHGLIIGLAHFASDPEVEDTQFHQILAEHAEGWKVTSTEDIVAVRDMLRTASVAAHVWYPTPRIAYVRMLDETPDQKGQQYAQILTLVWHNATGWKLFGVGQYLPWMIPFASGELDTDPLDGRKRS